MGLGNNEKHIYLKLKEGKVLASDGRQADYIEGRITDVTTAIRQFNGEDVELVYLTFISDGEGFLLGMNRGTGLTWGILNMLTSAEALGVVRITPYMKDGWQRATVTNDGTPLRWKYPNADGKARAEQMEGLLAEVRGIVARTPADAPQQTPHRATKKKRGAAALSLPVDPNEHKRGEPAGMPF